jgi:hypothetical protein
MDVEKRNAAGLSRGPWPWGVVGMALLVLGVEACITRHEAFTSLASAEHRFADRAAREARRYEILCFGDSQTKDGFIPRVFETRLGKRAINLSIPGSPSPSTYLLLRRALESGARPAAILVDYHAWLLQVDPRQRANVLAELGTLRDCVELSRAARDTCFLGELVTSRLLPSVRSRDEIRANLLAALRGEPSGPWQRMVAPARRNWLVNRGAQVMPRNPEAVTIAKFWDEAASYPDRWDCVPLDVTYVKRFLRLAAAERIPVFFLIPPRHPRVQANREKLGLDALYTRFVSKVTAGFPNVTVIDARRSSYDPSVFIDSSHFDRQGASDYSDAVASIVADRLGSSNRQGERWIDLPRHQIRPEPVAMEDLAQSEVALQAVSAGLRR